MTRESLKVDDRVNKIIASRIKTKRKNLRMSLDTLAEKIGVSSQQLFKYEGNFSVISIGRLLLIAKALKVSLNYFFMGLDGNSVYRKPTEEEKFGMNYLKLSNEHKEGIHLLIRKMVKEKEKNV